MIHILFGASPSNSLKVDLKDLKVDKEEQVIAFLYGSRRFCKVTPSTTVR
ncbi:hypothetical protein PY093_04105 [Cytobacillus sp. S13-E01]|nr:hypothetical protein [Cytobacillus sp. S13-E01]MDF0725897.1 hypothetical protein [Cytobacillus sp. S13-E01]